MEYVFTKLSAMSSPETENVNVLCRESVTSQGMDERSDPTDAHNPTRTRREGTAQQSSVLKEVNRDK